MKFDDIIRYVEYFLNKIIKEKITINNLEDRYIINEAIECKIYEFWNKKDSDLLKDFKNFQFEEDIISTIFFFLSGYWEKQHSMHKDEYGRYNLKESFVYKKGVLEDPVVDILVARLMERLGLTYQFEKPMMFITHDIDHLDMFNGLSFIKSVGADIIKRKNINSAIDKVIKKLKGVDPYSVQNLLDIHEKNNSVGTFFFMPGKQEKKVSAGYSLKNKQITLRKLEKRIMELNSNIGVHYDSRHLKENRMQKDIEVLNSIFKNKISSGRAHYLIFDMEKSFALYDESDIKLDSTGGFADSLGFRFGTSYPFRPYNFNENCMYNFYEVPLLVMDTSLQNPNYMNLNPREGFDRVTQMMDKVKEYKGVFTILWHNTSFYSHSWRNWENVYESIIEYGRNKEFEFVSSDNLLSLYNEVQSKN